MQKSLKKYSYDEIPVKGDYMQEKISWYNTSLCQYGVLFPHTLLHSRFWGNHEVRHFLYSYTAIEFIVKGSAIFDMDGKKTKVREGDVFIIRRGRNSGFTMTGEFNEKMAICLSGTFPDFLLNSLHLDEVPKITLQNTDEAVRRFLELKTLLKEKTPGTENLLSERMFSLFLFLSEENRTSRQLNYPMPLKKALSLLQDSDFGYDISIADIAKATGISTQTLIRLFRRYCGKSPMEYITGMRMEFAKELLESTRLCIKEISARAGYNSQLYFSTVFRKYSGMSPRDFRKFSGNTFVRTESDHR